MTGSEWITAFAERLGLPGLDEGDVDALLDVASVAAHSSERLAAPLTCYLVGVAGMAPTRALELARTLSDELGDGADR